MARYDKCFEPLLLEDQTATLLGTGLPEQGLNVRCVAVGALPEYAADFGAVAAGAWDTENSDANLEMNTLEFSQLRMRVISEMKIRMSHPSAVKQWKTKSGQFSLPQFPIDAGDFLQEYYWKASEFFIFEDNTPVFDLYATRVLASSIVLFSGWRYKLQDIKSQPGRIRIWTSEWPSISGTPRYENLAPVRR